MEKTLFNVSRDANTMLGFAFFNAVSLLPKEVQTELAETYQSAVVRGDGGIEVELVTGEIRLPLRPFFDRLQEQFDERTLKDEKEMAVKYFGDKLFELEDLFSEVRTRLEFMVSQLSQD